MPADSPDIVLGITSVRQRGHQFKRLVFSMEKFSNHPIAKAITNEWKINNPINWKKIEEIKGLGIKAEDKEGNIYDPTSSKKPFGVFTNLNVVT